MWCSRSKFKRLPDDTLRRETINFEVTLLSGPTVIRQLSKNMKAWTPFGFLVALAFKLGGFELLSDDWVLRGVVTIGLPSWCRLSGWLSITIASHVWWRETYIIRRPGRGIKMLNTATAGNLLDTPNIQVTWWNLLLHPSVFVSWSMVRPSPILHI